MMTFGRMRTMMSTTASTVLSPMAALTVTAIRTDNMAAGARAAASAPGAMRRGRTVASAPRQKFAATVAALTYTAFALLTFVALRVLGWLPPAFPPLVVAGALAMDLVRARTRSMWAIGAAFAAAFVLAEGARLLLFTPPPPSAGSLADPQFRGLVLTYYYAAAARPWLSAWPIAAALLGTPLAAAAVWLGRAAGRLAVDR